MTPTTATQNARPAHGTALINAERSSAASSQSMAYLNKNGRTTRSLTERDTLRAAAQSRRAFTAVLNSACTRHGARAGQGCWSVPRIDRGPSTAVCASRVALVFLGGIR